MRDDTSESESGEESRPAPNNNNIYDTNERRWSWRHWKEKGKQAYLREEYATALQNYSQALRRTNNATTLADVPSKRDQQILYSNMVACRLKLGGGPQAEAAIVVAKKCVALDDTWPKGHLRLAEARLALSKAYDSVEGQDRRKEESEKACEALRTVLQLDPGNQAAQDLLTKEIRYWAVGDNASGNTTTNSSGDGDTTNHSNNNTSAPEPSAPPESMDDNNTTTGGGATSYSNSNESSLEYLRNRRRRSNNSQGNSNASSSSSNNNNSHSSATTDIDDEDENYVHTPSFQDRLVFGLQRIRFWYINLSENDKMFVKIALTFVVLYVGFGGRFGLEYLGKSTPPSRSNDVYEEFYRTRHQSQPHRHTQQQYDSHRDDSYDRGYGSSSSSYGSSHDNGYNDGYRSNNGYSSWDGGGYNSYHRQPRRSFSAWPSALSGGNYYQYMMLVSAAAYVGNRYFGLRPHHVFFLANMLTGRRMRPRYGFGGIGFGGGYGGFGRGFGRGYGRNRFRPGNMWR